MNAPAVIKKADVVPVGASKERAKLIYQRKCRTITHEEKRNSINNQFHYQCAILKNLIKILMASEEMQTNDYILGLLLTLVILFGYCGNILVVYSILKERRLLKSNYYYLVLNLAICDAFHVVTALRFNYTNWFKAWPLTAVSCKIWLYFEMLLCHSGVQFMVLICIFRYRAVLYPLKPPIPRRKLKLMPILLFIIISIYLIPYIIIFEYSPHKGCYQKWSNKTLGIIYTSLSLNLHFLLPVTIMSVLYYKICRALVSEAKKMNFLQETENVSRIQDSMNEPREHSQRIRHNRNTRTFLVSAMSVSIFTLAAFPGEIWWICDANGFGIVKSEYAGWFYLSYMIACIVIC